MYYGFVRKRIKIGKRGKRMTVKITGAGVYDTGSRGFVLRDLFFTDGIISAPSAYDKTIDAGGKLLVPGLIDVHTHGRAGIDIMEADEHLLSELSEKYCQSGVTSVFPTVMTAPPEKLSGAIRRIKAAKDTGAGFCGIHVEGPYISPEKPGCHNVSFIRKPKAAEMIALAKEIFPLRAHFTCAPEEAEPGAIKALSEYATVGIGHTKATDTEAWQALSDGAVSFTHTFNAMSPLTHRNTGAAGVALASGAYAEFIVDGMHVSKTAVLAAYNAKLRTPSRFVLITDSIPQAGLPYGSYAMNGIKFRLGEDGAREENGTLVGSTLSLIGAVKNLMRFCGISFGEAVAFATEAPAKMVGIYDKVGSLDIGKRADILICSPDGSICTVIAGGKIKNKQ